MRLVEHNCVVRRNDRSEVILVIAHGEVGEEQVVVDHYDVRLAGSLVHLRHIAFGESLALPAGASLAARVEPRPKLAVRGKPFQIGAITCLGMLLPIADQGELARLLEPVKRRFAFLLGQFLDTDEVVPALHYGDLQGLSDGSLQEWHILAHQLFLQVLGSGRDHSPAAG